VGSQMTPRSIRLLRGILLVPGISAGIVDASCAASDARLERLKGIVCASIEGSAACSMPSNLTVEGDWPDQVIYMHDLLLAVAGRDTCLNTSRSSAVIEWLDVIDPKLSPWWWTWLVFQPQYYEMPRKPGDRIESPATLGRKCWAFAYLRQIWASLKVPITRAVNAAGLSLTLFTSAFEHAVPTTMDLCSRVMANCFVNASYNPSLRNGTCPQLVREFIVGFYWENGGGGRGPLPRELVHFPFPAYHQPAAFRTDVQFAVDTALNYII